MLLEIEKLNIRFNGKAVLKDFNLQLQPNTVLGIVGESGSGKSLSVLSILDILPKHASVAAEKMIFNGIDLLKQSSKQKRSIRGSEVSMIFQEPMSSLNPSITCGEQVAEVLLTHKKCSKTVVEEEVSALFQKVKLPDPATTYNKYPHQISGGQKQRVMIAMAIACKPKLLIADEPTTALDVSVQKEIIQLLKSLQEDTEMGIIFISHDLALVKHIADEILVLYKGKTIEKGVSSEIFDHPKETYTKALLAARPQPDIRLKRLPTIQDFTREKFVNEVEQAQERKERHISLYSAKPVLEVRNLNKSFRLNASLLGKPAFFKAIDDISFDLFKGEKLGVVGESGCGKTTLGHLITGLIKSDSGNIVFNGRDLLKMSSKEFKPIKKDIQIIFQDPYSSLNPRMTIGDAIAEPMKVHGLVKDKKQRRKAVEKLLEAVGLFGSHYDRYPHEFSGGQRQRIGIARCLALRPKIIICDESVSALDISVQAQVLNLLEDLKDKFQLTYIFISHDLSVVRQFSDRILVMKSGKIIEQGEADILYDSPKSDYTKELINAVPV
jgi:peptide/nickel transport system ATP-binding protein